MSRIYGLTCEYKENPVCVDVPRPRFGWKLASEKQNVMQAAFKLTVTAEDGGVVWTLEEDGDRSVHVEYGGPALRSNTRYYYKVLAVLGDGETISSDGTDYFETGLFRQKEWQAGWIGGDYTKSGQTAILRREFSLEKKVVRARIFATAAGLYQLYLNGELVGDDLLTPGWTSYHSHLQYQSYDVTGLLNEGNNALGIRLGDGWFSGVMNFEHHTKLYGERPAAMAQLMLRYEDGTEALVLTDGSWRTDRGGVIFSEFYDGEITDQRLEPKGWSCAGFDDGAWRPAEMVPYQPPKLVGMVGEGVRRIQELKPVSIFTTPAGETVLDMGQNMVGWVKVTVRGAAGDAVHLKHAEVLDSAGNFYTDNIRDAKQETMYILEGGDAVLEPHFSFQGFRYVKILAFPGTPSLEHFTGVVIHTDMKQTMDFSCGDPLVNGLWHNILWGQKGNFVDVPTDCPQRDERLGWTGDAQVFCRTAAFNYRSAAFFTKWLADVRADQFQNGAVPFVVPNILPRDWRFLQDSGLGYEHASAGWGEAIVVMPWALYLSYGDTRILEENYPAMERYVAYIHDGAANGSGNPYLWDWGPQLGDWLALDNEEGSYRGGTDESLVATAFYAHAARLTGKCARVLGREVDAQKYETLFRQVVQAFHETYMKDGRVVQQTQTAHVLPLAFGILTEDEAKEAAKRLTELLADNGDHLTTGFLGTPYLCQVLTENGHADVAYRLLMQQDYPSWLYQVTKGATTIWEHWDGLKPDGTMWSPAMNSFNHYAYGAIGEWLYRYAAGIDTDEERSGYKHIRIAPQVSASLGEVSCRYESVYGVIFSGWQVSDGQAAFHIVIPANTTAEICLPGLEPKQVGSGEYRFSCKLPA